MVIKKRHWALPTATLVLLLPATGCLGASDAPGPSAEPTVTPTTSVARVCATPAPGPAQAPAGAVTVDPSVVGDLAAKTRSSPRRRRSGSCRERTR